MDGTTVQYLLPAPTYIWTRGTPSKHAITQSTTLGHHRVADTG